MHQMLFMQSLVVYLYFTPTHLETSSMFTCTEHSPPVIGQREGARSVKAVHLLTDGDMFL